MIMIVYKRKNIIKLLQVLQSGSFTPNLERGGIQEYKIVSDAIKLVNRMVSLGRELQWNLDNLNLVKS